MHEKLKSMPATIVTYSSIDLEGLLETLRAQISSFGHPTELTSEQREEFNVALTKHSEYAKNIRSIEQIMNNDPRSVITYERDEHPTLQAYKQGRQNAFAIITRHPSQIQPIISDAGIIKVGLQNDKTARDWTFTTTLDSVFREYLLSTSSAADTFVGTPQNPGKESLYIAPVLATSLVGFGDEVLKYAQTIKLKAQGIETGEFIFHDPFGTSFPANRFFLAGTIALTANQAYEMSGLMKTPHVQRQSDMAKGIQQAYRNEAFPAAQ